MKKFTSLFLFILFIGSSIIVAQRRGNVTYTSLANRASTSNFFFDNVIIPDESQESAQLVFLFRMDNSFLPFKKLSIDDNIENPKDAEFYSIARLSSEIFQGKASKNELKNSSSISRDLWKDTLYTETYDQTKSKEDYASGKLVTKLKPGDYNYVLQLSLMEETNDRNSQRRNISIPDFKTKKTGEIYLLNNNSDLSHMEFMNMGNNVIYGKDYKVLIRIPEYNSTQKYHLRVSKAKINRKDTTNSEIVKNIQINSNEISANSSIELIDSIDPAVSLNSSKGSYSYVLLTVPNSGLENSIYNLELMSNSTDEVLAEKLIRSYWPDIPPSLLNLDISIEMMRYIVSEEQLKNLKKGNSEEKEEKFRDFWKKRDPTPETEFNELMTEYYRRIHYAFIEYRSPENPNGQDTDRGEVYIKYGPPNERDRSFPKKGLVIETWKYNDRSFVFEKGSGFSEFMLVGK
ncbi:MAG: GWxTD domain-containing protein [Balneola sp.]